MPKFSLNFLPKSVYVSYDKVKYFEKDESNSVYEEMLEIEDWKKPNTTDVDYDYDRHLIEVHNLISKAQLPIELTKYLFSILFNTYKYPCFSWNIYSTIFFSYIFKIII